MRHSTLHHARHEPDVVSQMYAWADRPSSALILRNQSVSQLRLLGDGQGLATGLPLYVFQERPCLYVTIVGMVVGITEKDHKWDYLVDDGSTILDVVIHQQHIPLSVNGLSAEPSSSLRTLDHPGMPNVACGDIVRVTGKVWRRFRSRRSDSSSSQFGLDAHDIDLLNHDPTAEARHNLQAHRLAQTEYWEPLELHSTAFPIVEIDLPTPPPGSQAEVFPDAQQWMEDKFSTSLRHLGAAEGGRGRYSGAPQRASSMEPSTGKSLPRQLQQRDLALKLSASQPQERTEQDTASGRPSSDTSGALVEDAVATKRRARTVFQAKQGPERYDADEAVSKRSRLTDCTNGRHLRSPSKMRDSDCTESAFRIHVQKFLSDQYRRQGRGKTAFAREPPAFTMMDLMNSASIFFLADRIVRIRLQRRARRRADERVTPSQEPRNEKTRRLFEWCIRQMLVDGFIVLAASDSDRRLLLPIEDSSPVDHIDASEGDLNTRHASFLHQNEGLSSEAYTLVNRTSLSRAIRQLSSTGGLVRYSGSDLHHIADSLRRSDQRWTYITNESIEQALSMGA